MSKVTLSEAQNAIIKSGTSGANLGVRSGAGTGKTFIAIELIKAMDKLGKRGALIFFGAANAADGAKRITGLNAECRTWHSLAWADAPQWMRDRRGNLASWVINKNLNIRDSVIAHMTVETLKRFCHSADTVINEHHVPVWRLKHATDDLKVRIKPKAVKFARMLWDETNSPISIQPVPFEVILKSWELTNPKLPYDYIIVDEFQDSNSAYLSVLNANPDIQVIGIGDENQAIYGFAGGVDAFNKFKFDENLLLGHSYRNPDELAKMSAKFLNKYNDPETAKVAFTGVDKPLTVYTDKSKFTPSAFISRTNAGVFDYLVAGIEDDTSMALVQKATPIKTLLRSMDRMKRGLYADHPDMVGIDDWGHMMELHDNKTIPDLHPYVDALNKYSFRKLIDSLEKCEAKRDADTILTTAHKVKGLEFDTIMLSGNFKYDHYDSRFDPEPTKESADVSTQKKKKPKNNNSFTNSARNLLYVAMTRAKNGIFIKNTDGLNTL